MADYKTPGVYVEAVAPNSNIAGGNASAPSTEIWPLPAFTFSVTWDGAELAFQEVTGLSSEKTQGQKPGNIIMQKGVFKGDSSLWNTFESSKMNTVNRSSIAISLLDESGNITMTWNLANAWATKITGTDLKSEGNEIAIESVEIAYEGITVSS